MRKWIAGTAAAMALVGTVGGLAVPSLADAAPVPVVSTQTPPPPSHAQAAYDKLKARLDKAVAAGKITQAQEDKVLQRFQNGQGKAFRRFAVVQGAIRVSAKTIGIKPKDLTTELRTGKSVADVAAEHHVDRQKVLDALVAAGDKRIDTALSKGNLTPQQANALKARVPAAAAKFIDHKRTPKPQG